MKLIDIFNNKCVCLDFTEEVNADLEQFNFIKVTLKINFRSKNYQDKLYKIISEYVRHGDMVFMTLPRFTHMTPAIMGTIFGITGNLPHIVYFKEKAYGDKLVLVSSIEKIRREAELSSKLNTTPATLV